MKNKWYMIKVIMTQCILWSNDMKQRSLFAPELVVTHPLHWLTCILAAIASQNGVFPWLMNYSLITRWRCRNRKLRRRRNFATLCRVDIPTFSLWIPTCLWINWVLRWCYSNNYIYYTYQSQSKHSNWVGYAEHMKTHISYIRDVR